MDNEGAQSVYEVAVVGESGFLGSAVVSALENGGHTVRGFSPERPAIRGRVLDPALTGPNLRAVVWCASRMNPRLVASEPELAEADLADVENMVAALAELDAPPHLILLSSGGTVYGPPSQPPFNEAMAPAPVNAYGDAKLAQEQVVLDGRIPATVLRIANAYGPGQRPAPGQAVLAHWLTAIAHDEPVRLYGDAHATRDYVYVEDIAHAVVDTLGRLPAGAVVNIGSGVATSLEDLLAVVREVVAPREVEVERSPGRVTDTTHSVLDVTLADVMLGWQPRVGLAQGVRAMWEWMNQ